MATWDELRAVLLRLRDEQPDLLLGYPNPYSDRPKVPPFRIRLASTAEALAEDLHRRFGDDLDLIVGSLPYPPRRQHGPPALRSPRRLPELLDPQEITVELDGPATVRSGHTDHHWLLVKNLTGDEIQIATNGHLTASVVDPSTGEIVGGFAGMQAMPLVRYRVAGGAVERIPLLIGTDSVVPRLGYTVPPGSWGIQAVLSIGPTILDIPNPREALHKRTPILPLEITA
jgi:hypothetical protein